jgi:hypothetical protein
MSTSYLEKIFRIRCLLPVVVHRSTQWADGTPISEEENTDLLDRLVNEAANRGWKFEIEW